MFQSQSAACPSSVFFLSECICLSAVLPENENVKIGHVLLKISRMCIKQPDFPAFFLTSGSLDGNDGLLRVKGMQSVKVTTRHTDFQAATAGCHTSVATMHSQGCPVCTIRTGKGQDVQLQKRHETAALLSASEQEKAVPENSSFNLSLFFDKSSYLCTFFYWTILF